MGITQTITEASEALQDLTSAAERLVSLGYEVDVDIRIPGQPASPLGHHGTNGSSATSTILGNAVKQLPVNRISKYSENKRNYWSKIRALAKRHGCSNKEARRLYRQKQEA